MLKRLNAGTVGVLAGAALAAGMAAVPAAATKPAGGSPVKHVLLISVDGLHQTDLEWFVDNHPESELAQLVNGGVSYTKARTPIPSDSFPGMVAQVTGANPRTAGVYYDVSYNHELLAPGSACTPGAYNGPGGTEVAYDESIDLNKESIAAGQELANLPGVPGLNNGVMDMTATPRELINPAVLPLNPNTCKPVYPNEYLRVNTVFNVLHEHGLRTAWSDKHPAYSILEGPSGNGIDDLFTPEINSNAYRPNGEAYGGDWTSHNDATRQYDEYKVQAVVNELTGYDHSGTSPVGVPAILGMNFQTISTAEKLPASQAVWGGPTLTGGYLPGTDTPGPLLANALEWLDAQVGRLRTTIANQGLAGSTAIVLSAKHGQSPQNPRELVRIDDGAIIENLNAAWAAKYPSAPPLVVGGTDDDAINLYLSNRSKEATKWAANWLMTHSAVGYTYNEAEPTKKGPAVTVGASGLVKIYAGQQAANYFGVSASDPRHPDLWGIVQQGVVYTGGAKKIAEHGGANTPDRAVALVVDAPGVSPRMVKSPVETTQIAPTILQLLGFSPEELQGVREEGTQVLPKVG